MSGIDFERALNREQFAAVTGPDGPVLVLAAAGTGKTRTLVYRVAYLVGKGIAPDRILLLTFTNRASGEMLERARNLVGPHVAEVWGGTFHHMANRILRRYAPAIGYENDYTILDRDDSLKLVADGVRDLGLQSKTFPKPNVLLHLFSAATNTETPLDTYLEEHFTEVDVAAGDIVKVHRAYEAKKRKLQAMDFDDMLVNGLRLFRERADVLGHYQEQFMHVLVDEYQDTNTIQAQLVDRLVGGHGNVMVVGDDFQSIYSWRGADFRNIMSFTDRYPKAVMFKLETNYRSVPEILAVANACIAGNPDQYQKTLRSTRERRRRPRVIMLRDGDAQARYVIEHVRMLRRDGYKLSDIAVLYRAHYHSMELQMELAREGVAFTITSGMRFFEQAHIKDTCGVLRLLENPGDEIAFLRLMGLLPGVGERTAAKLWDKLGGKFDAADAAQRDLLRGALPRAAGPAWHKIEPVLTAYRDEKLQDDGGEVIYRFVQAFYREYAELTFENADRRLDDIQELILYTAKFENVETFLSDVALITNLDAEYENVEGSEEETLRLSTVHQAKGLEWSAVVLLWVTENMFPLARTMNESSAGEAEERRLFYVAITRAKDDLCLCVPEVRRTRDGGVQYLAPSRFLTEIPRGLVEEVRAGFI